MNRESTLKREFQSENDWLKGIFNKSNSHSSLNHAETTLRLFDIWCKEKLELPNPELDDLTLKYTKMMVNSSGEEYQRIDKEWADAIKERYAPIYSKARKEVITQYSDWFSADKPDIQSICTSLNKFVTFCGEDHPEVMASRRATWKAKKSSSIRGYFSALKEFLRKCHGIRITSEDVKDFIDFSKEVKESRAPIELATIKQVLSFADPRRRAMYYLLLTSGMRLGEALSLKKTSFKVDVRPIKIHLRAQDTKTNEARDTFISEEAWEKVEPIYSATKDGQYVFHDFIFGEEVETKVIPTPTPKPIVKAVFVEDRYFARLRRKIAEKYNNKERCEEYPDGTGILKRYESSNRYLVQIHAFRAWFITQASLKHGTDYAHAIAGHHSYMDTYIRIADKTKSKMYLELEKSLLLESSKMASEQFHEKEVEELREEMQQQKAQIEKLQRGDYHRTDFEAESRFGVTS